MQSKTENGTHPARPFVVEFRWRNPRAGASNEWQTIRRYPDRSSANRALTNAGTKPYLEYRVRRIDDSWALAPGDRVTIVRGELTIEATVSETLKLVPVRVFGSRS